MNYFYQKKPIVGLDISQTGIKAMSIVPKEWLVKGYGSLDLDPNKVQAALDGDDDVFLTENLTKMLKDNVIGALKSNHVAISIPTAKTFSRTFVLPVSQLSHVKDAVNMEAIQYIPVDVKTLYLAHEIVDRRQDTVMVVMTAAPKTVVDAAIKAARGAELEPLVVEPSINAVARTLEATEEGHLTTMIVDIGATSTDIAVLDKGIIRVTSSVPVGGNSFTIDISKKLAISLEEAHQEKINHGLVVSNNQAQITDALSADLKQITSEIKKVIRYYKERIVEDRNVEQILIVGGGANVPGIGDYFTNALVMPARVAIPWQKLNFGKLPAPKKQFQPRYISVTGLAILPEGDIWK